MKQYPSQRNLNVTELGLASLGNFNHLIGNTATVLERPEGASSLALHVESGNFRVKLGDYSELGAEIVTDGDFPDDTNWTLGDGATVAAGVLAWDGSQAAPSDAEQVIASGLEEGEAYTVAFDVVSQSAGSVAAVVGGTAGTSRSTVATFTETLIAGEDGEIILRADADFIGSVDNISVKQAVLVYAAPTVNQEHGYGTFKLLTDAPIMVSAPEFITVIGSDAGDVLTYWWI